MLARFPFGLDGFAQPGVVRMGEKAGAQRPQRFRHLVAQVAADGDAGFVPGRAPTLPWAIFGFAGLLTLRGAEAAGMGEQPAGGEVCVQLLAEHGLQIDLEIGGAGQAGVVAQDAQPQAVDDDGPEAGVGGVQRFLRQHEGTAPTDLAGIRIGITEALRRRIERLIVGGENQRHPTAEGRVADWIAVACLLDGGRPVQVGEAQHVAQQRDDELARRHRLRVDVLAAAQALEIQPEVERDLPVARNLVAQFQALGDAVVAFGLLGPVRVGERGQA